MMANGGDGMMGADVGGEDLRQIAKALDIAKRSSAKHCRAEASDSNGGPR